MTRRRSRSAVEATHRRQRDSVASIVFVAARVAFGMIAGGCVSYPIPEAAIEAHDRGIAYLTQGQCVRAEESCRFALEFGVPFAHAHNCLGMVEQRCWGDLARAKQHFKDALSINSDFPSVHNNLGSVFFHQTPPDYRLACEAFEASLEIAPTYQPGRENLGMCLARQGTVLGEQGDLDARTRLYRRAKSQFRRLIEVNAHAFRAYEYLGFMAMKEGRLAAAVEHFERCLEIRPDSAVCNFYLGQSHLEEGRCAEAIPAFVAALRDKNARDVSVETRASLGAAYEMCAKLDGAVKAFIDHVRRNPGNPAHHYDLGNIYADKGLFDHAVHEWQIAVKLDPTYCPAYYELSMYANRTLDTERMVARCHDFVTCATQVDRGELAPQWPDRVSTCQRLVRLARADGPGPVSGPRTGPSHHWEPR